MSVNRAEQTLGDRLVNEIESLKRQMEDIKTAQLLGADSVQVGRSNTVATVALTMPSGNTQRFGVAYIPQLGYLTLADLFISIYIDNDADSDYLYPNGGALTTDKKAIAYQWHPDWATSEDGTGIRRWRYQFTNNCTTTSTLYIKLAVYSIMNPSA